MAIKESAVVLRNQGDEWYAVCFFYAAYHMVKAALIEDPVFDDLARLQGINSNLVPDDRFATRHHGFIQVSTRVMGINDIVRALYPEIAAEYVRLHMASIEVRYGTGLGVISQASVDEDYEAVVTAYREFRLRA